MTDAINKLNSDQREVIITKYMSRKKQTNIEVYMSIGWSESHFYRLKKSALEDLLEAYLAEKVQNQATLVR